MWKLTKDNERLKERYYVAIDTLNEYKFGEMNI